MAPELLKGETGSYPSDIWALGVLLYEAATGQLPFAGSTAYELSAAILHQAPRPLPSSVPPSLTAVIMRCLTKDVKDRFQRASEIRSMLEAIIALVTLTAMEIVLGIDNIIFIAIIAGRLPPEQQGRARTLGLVAALGTRLLLLFAINLILHATQPLFCAHCMSISVSPPSVSVVVRAPRSFLSGSKKWKGLS